MTSTKPANTPKPLVLCADDYAQDASVSHAIVRLATQGRLSATSAMVLSPRWGEDAAALATLRGRIDVGLHLDFTSPHAQAAGHGMTLAAAMRRALLGGFDRGAARILIERQLDLFEAHWQAPPDHVDGHQHVQQFAGLREPLVALLARRYGSAPPWLRVSRPPPGQADVKSSIIAWMGARRLSALADAAGLPHAAHLSGIYDFTGGASRYADLMQDWLLRSPGQTVLMCHPGTGEADALAPPDPITSARTAEWRHLSSNAFTDQLAAAHATLVRGSTLYTHAP